VITDEEFHDQIRDRLRMETAHLTLGTDPVPWVHSRLRRRRNVQTGGIAAVVLVATVAATVLSVRETPTPSASRTTPTLLQRFHAALMDAVSNSVLKIDMHGDTVWVHQGVGRSISANGLYEDVVTTHDGELTATTVNYTTKTWSTSTMSSSSVAAGGVPENPCIGFGYNLLTFADPTALQQELHAEQFIQLPGTHVVNGQTTVELASACDGKVGNAAIYLNDDTLVPVEVVNLFAGTPDPDPLLTFEVVPATSANLANLKLQIPSGFTEVPQGG
jgi:hypothetical protein